MKYLAFFLFFLGLLLGGLFWYTGGFIPENQVSLPNISLSDNPEEKEKKASKSFTSVPLLVSSTKQIVCDTTVPRTVHQWRLFLQADTIVNGGYFTAEFEPSGFVKMQKESWGDVQSYPAFFGITSDGGMSIARADEWDNDRFSFALSSFPLLIENGKSTFQKETNKPARRTLIAQKGNDFFFLFFEGYPTLFEAGQILEAQGFDMALNLDGGPSTGISSDDTLIPSVFVPCVIAVWEE